MIINNYSSKVSPGRGTLERAFRGWCRDVEHAQDMILPDGRRYTHAHIDPDEMNLTSVVPTFAACEHERLHEIARAMSGFVDEMRLPLVGRLSKPADMFNWALVYTNRIIAFCRSLPAYQRLSERDRVVIFSRFMVEFCSVRMAYTLDRERNGFQGIEDESAVRAVFVPLDMANELRDQATVQEHIRFSFALHDAFEQDPIIRDLLIAQLLFKPREDITSSQYVM